MAFIPHTADDIAQMLQVIGVQSIEDLFDEIPRELRAGALDVPPAMGEMELGRLMSERAASDGRPLNFIGAGAYEHHIPGAGMGDHDARRILFRVHAVPSGGQPGHLAIDL